jgi:hypothetical protein
MTFVMLMDAQSHWSSGIVCGIGYLSVGRSVIDREWEPAMGTHARPFT